MRSKLARLALLALLSLLGLSGVACDNGPDVGSPGLEPPRSEQDGGPEGVGAGAGAGAGASGMQGSSVDNAGHGGSSSGSAGSASTPTNSPADAGAGGFGNLQDGGDGGDASALRFSDEHAAEIAKDCQETVSCRLQRDEPLPDDALEQCLANTAMTLDDDQTLQANYLVIVARCASFVVCDYVDCTLQGP